MFNIGDIVYLEDYRIYLSNTKTTYVLDGKYKIYKWINDGTYILNDKKRTVITIKNCKTLTEIRRNKIKKILTRKH